MRPTPLYIAVLLALACGTTPAAPEPDAGPAPEPDAGPSLAPLACALEPLPSLGSRLSGPVHLGEQGLFYAHGESLWHAASLDEPLTRLTSLPVLDRQVTSLVATAHAIHVVVSGNPPRAFESSDAGATWVERSEGLDLLHHVDLVTDGERLIASGANGLLAELDLASSRWLAVEASPPEPTAHFDLRAVGFDAEGAIVANDVYGGGLVRLARGAVAWERIAGLGEWGYSSFVARDGLELTANRSGAWTALGGVGWARTLEVDSLGLRIADAGTRLLAYDAVRLFESTDGSSWTAMVAGDAPFSGIGSLAAHGDDVVWRGDVLRTSRDGGSTWTDSDVALDDVAALIVRGDRRYARIGREWKVGSAEGWQDPPWSDDAVVSVGPSGAWACEGGRCREWDDALAPIGTIELPHAHVSRVFATSHGLFVARDPLWEEPCRATIGRGLWRWDGEWTEASTGLTSEPVQAPSACAGEPSYWSVQNLVEVDGVLLAAVTESSYVVDSDDGLLSGYDARTLRSTDGGLTWTEIASDYLRAAARTDAGMFYLFDRDGLRAGDDLHAVPAPPGEGALRDLVAIGQTLVVARHAWRGPSIFLGDGSGPWSALGSLGPVRDLSVDGARLGAATRTSGAWLQPDCR